jgi:nucleoside transporter
MKTVGMGNLTNWPYMVNPIAAIIAPFFVGLVADRYFATEKVLALLHLAGGVLLLLVPALAGQPLLFISVLLLYNLCYMPTLGLANSLALHHIEDAQRQFPRIRVMGTIGWIAAGLFLSLVLGPSLGITIEATGFTIEATAWPLRVGGIASLVLGVFCLGLPHTPPRGRGEQVSLRTIAGLDALKTLGSVPFYVFLASSFLLCIPLAAYYNYTQLYLESAGFSSIAGTQTYGQMSEVLFMLLMPFFFRKLGVRYMLMIGMLAWVARYCLFAIGAPDAIVWMIISGIVLHGICYDFFFVTGQIYVDQKSTAKIRGQAQGLLVLATYGVGMLVGAKIAGNIYKSFLQDQAALSLAQWQTFWWYPAAFALLILIGFALTFRDKVNRA